MRFVIHAIHPTYLAIYPFIYFFNKYHAQLGLHPGLDAESTVISGTHITLPERIAL